MRSPMLLVALFLSLATISCSGDTHDTERDSKVVCGHVCQCNMLEEGLSVHCIRMNLSQIPQGIPSNVTILDLSMNNISVLGEDSFGQAADRRGTGSRRVGDDAGARALGEELRDGIRGATRSRLPSLRRLDLRMNGMTDILPGALRGLVSMRELGLDHNHLSQLRAGVFARLPALAMLSLNNNRLATLEDAAFDGLSLKHLNLHDNNPLQKLSAEVFSGAAVETLSLDRCALASVDVDAFMPLAGSLSNLFWSHNLRPLHLPARVFQGIEMATLWLSDNRLTDLRFLEHTKALHLDLSRNPLDEFDMGLYSAMEHVELFNLSRSQLRRVSVSGALILFSLQELDLSDNFIFSLDGDLFQRMPSLTRLDISGNRLLRVGASLHLILYQLEFWDLTGNPLLCDCRLEWLRHWAQTQNKTHIQGAVCALPRLEPVIGAEPFTCLLPTILRISTDAGRGSSEDGGPGSWHLQCDAEGWPTPEVTWSFNMSRHQAVQAEVHWISYHGHPYRNSSLLVLTALRPLPAEYCFHFGCTASNSEGTDTTEYVHCARGKENASSDMGDNGGTVYSSNYRLRAIGNDNIEAGEGVSPEGSVRAENASSEAAPTGAACRHQSLPAAASSDQDSPPPAPLSAFASPAPSPSSSSASSSLSAHSLSRLPLGVSAVGSVVVLVLGVLGLLLGVGLYAKRRKERLASRPGDWDQPDGGTGEGLTDSTKCLVEHNESAEKRTFSIDTV